MPRLIFITPQEMSQTTIMGGNVDVDKYVNCIDEVQIRVIKRLLGEELYNKIVSDLESDNLTGLYLKLFTDFVKPITKYESLASYIEISVFSLANNGLTKRTSENANIPTIKEVEWLSSKQSSIAQSYVNEFEKWIGLNKTNIPEYKLIQDGVNAENINTNNGWYMED